MIEKKFNLKEANGMFVAIGLLLVFLGSYLQTRWLIPGLIITQYGIILLPVMILIWIKKKNFHEALSIKKLPVKIVFKIMSLAVLFIPLIAAGNLLVMSIINYFSKVVETPIPVAETGWEYLLYMFVISITAGICEEFFFRGMVLGGYQNSLNYKSAAIWSAIMFGFFHFNPQNLIGPILLGLLFAYLVQITGSIWAGVVAHMTNNGVAVTLSFLANAVQSSEVSQSAMKMEDISSAQWLITSIFLLVVFLAASIGVKRLLKSIKREYPKYATGEVLKINREKFEVQSVDEESRLVFVKNVYDEEGKIGSVSFDQLKRFQLGGDYKLWKGQAFKMPLSTVLTFVPILIIYGRIIYIAYIRS